MTAFRQERYINPYTDFGFKKLFGKERRQYEASQKEYWDYTSTMNTAYNKGEQKGRAEANHAVAQKMKAMGLPTEQITAVTGLSIEEIQQL